jgi:hypothetical protein
VAGGLYLDMKAIDKLSKFARVLAVVGVTLGVPAVALAEDQGARGSVTELEINHSTSEAYLAQHGRVVVVTGKVSAEYRWGGVACGSRILPESMVAMLQRALESGTPIIPRWQDGQGSTRCLVGFKLVP